MKIGFDTNFIVDIDIEELDFGVRYDAQEFCKGKHLLLKCLNGKRGEEGSDWDSPRILSGQFVFVFLRQLSHHLLSILRTFRIRSQRR